jgi:starch phosphorylase
MNQILNILENKETPEIIKSFKDLFEYHLENDLIKDRYNATAHDILKAFSLTIRDYIAENWINTQKKYQDDNEKKVYYLSLEFLMGSLLGKSLINLELYEVCKQAFSEMGFDIDKIIELEPDMGLGNGGLGRLAACFLESLSTLEYSAYGYGIRYEYGIFEQEIEKGYQLEKPDNWLKFGNPWEMMRPEFTYRINFYGEIREIIDEKGKQKYEWEKTEDVLAVAYDIPVPGYKNSTVNNLRLWSARATEEFNLQNFNEGNYMSAVDKKNSSEVISKVLYPNDSFPSGKELRFKQQYFFVSATLQDIILQFKEKHSDFTLFTEKISIHLNDTHPAIAIAELMRIFIDVEGFDWDTAWEITKKTFAYTNHTILPEALEEWNEELIKRMLPRHNQIIHKINERFLNEVKEKITKDENMINRLSIFSGGKEIKIRMSNLAIIGSYSVNGVAELHTQILKNYTFPHFNFVFPGKFINITNGISPRVFLKQSNPLLSTLITENIGDGWIKDLNELRNLEKFINDSEFINIWKEIKYRNKISLSNFINQNYNILVNPESVFDSQIKRFHEYKRQLLNILHAISLYIRIKEYNDKTIIPRTVLISGKAAPSYFMAKLVIKLINSVADVVNSDPEVNDLLKIIFLKNYSVSLAEKIIPASELSEQISTAGFEASGTGNMKFALNGALTIGTMDGANIEIKNEVGLDNIFIFGLNANDIIDKRKNSYHPAEFLDKVPMLNSIINMLSKNYFNKDEPGIFKPIVDNLLNSDPYFVMADFESYSETQKRVENLYLNQTLWTQKSMINTSRSGKFSSDRSVKQYANEIWGLKSHYNLL